MSTPKQQLQLTWFLPNRPNDARKTALLGDDFRRMLCDPKYGSPFSRFLGNSEIVETLARAAFVALGRRNHCLSDQAFAFIGPASSGKATLARLFAETVGLPLVEVTCWSEETCQIAVRFGGKTPGDVLAFAQSMALEKQYTQNADWLQAAKIVAQRHRVVAAKVS